MKKRKIVLFISLVLCLSLISGNVFEVIHAESVGNAAQTAIMSDALVSALNSTRDEGNIDVVMWQKDIDHEVVEKQVENAISINRNGIDDKTDMETVQNYIAKKRYFAMKKYEALNESFVTNNVSKLDKTEIIFVSKFSPVVIASMPKSAVYSASKSSNVTYMDLFVNSEIVPFSNVANVNQGTAQLRDTSSINATGKGVKIGQVEPGVLITDTQDVISSYFNSSNLHPISTGTATTHASLVAAIMVGKTINYNGVEYKGIAPDAELYYADIFDDLTLITAIEDMMKSSNGVNVINMSAGSERAGEYDFLSQWIDHLAFVHDVHFVVAAGNYNPFLKPNYNVIVPGTAYNAIVVGNVYDSNALIGNNAPSSLSSQYLNSNFGVRHTSCYMLSESYSGYKPDIASWGTDIRYGIMEDTGTSFAAPQVTGIIAQLCETNPSLLLNNSKIKALLAATAVYRTYDDYEIEYINTSLLRRQGAGIANAVCAYNTVNAGKTKDVTMSGGAQYYTFTINVPSSYNYLRLAMAWIKKNSISGSHYLTNSNINNGPLANLRLEIFYGTDTSGSPIARSDSAGNNLELLQFNVEQGGTYTIRITNYNYNAGFGAQYISLAWY